MKKTIRVRSKYVVCCVVVGFGAMWVAMSGYSQEPEHSQYHPDFPRLGMIYIGGDQTYSLSTWPVTAKFNMVVMGGGRENWGDNRAWPREDVVNGVHNSKKTSTQKQGLE